MSTLTGGPAPQRQVPRAPEIKRYLQENAILGETRRFRQLDRFEAHYACRQYAHLDRDWWGMPADNAETISPEIQVPMGFTQPALSLLVRQKRPTAPYNLCKAVVDRFTGLLFSDIRHPDISVEGDADTEDFLQAVVEQSRFWAKMREARTMGGATGSVMVTVHLRDGKFVLEVHNPKHLQVVWKDRRALQPMAVLKSYRYPVEEDIVDQRTGELKGTRVVDYLYRRIITEDDDTVYRPAKLTGEGGIDWEVESEVKHGLGFFPGVWIQNLPVLENEDGDPDCHGSWQNFDTIDRLIAQMNKAVLLNLDPTLVTKIDPRTIEIQGGIQKGSDNALNVGQSGDAKYLEITGSGVDAGMKVLSSLKQNTLDVVRCVLVDPQTISGAAQSAKAIEYIYAPMLEKADDLRAQYGDLGVVPLMELVLKIARQYLGQTIKLGENKIGRYRFKLPPKVTKDAAGVQTLTERKPGAGGYIRLTWGPYFAPTEDDKQKAVSNIVAAKSGGVIDLETAIRQVAPLFAVRDVDGLIAKVREEAEAEGGDMFGGFGGFGGGEETVPEPGEPGTPGAGEGGLP